MREEIKITLMLTSKKKLIRDWMYTLMLNIRANYKKYKILILEKVNRRIMQILTKDVFKLKKTIF